MSTKKNIFCLAGVCFSCIGIVSCSVIVAASNKYLCNYKNQKNEYEKVKNEIFYELVVQKAQQKELTTIDKKYQMFYSTYIVNDNKSKIFEVKNFNQYFSWYRMRINSEINALLNENKSLFISYNLLDNITKRELTTQWNTKINSNNKIINELKDKTRDGLAETISGLVIIAVCSLVLIGIITYWVVNYFKKKKNINEK